MHRTVRNSARLALVGVLIGLSYLPSAPRLLAEDGQSAADDTEIVPASAKDAEPTETRDAPNTARLIARQASEFRRKNGLGELQVDKQLAAAARDFADYMAKHHRYGHHADGRTAAERAKEKGYDYCIVLENVAYQFSTRGFETEALARRTSEGWEESPEHRDNLLDADVTQIGVGVAQSADTGYYFAVQLFGRPKSEAISFSFTNTSDATIGYELSGKQYKLTPRQIRTHERCRPPKVVFAWPTDDSNLPAELQPKGGEQFVVSGSQAEGLKLAQRSSTDDARR